MAVTQWGRSGWSTPPNVFFPVDWRAASQPRSARPRVASRASSVRHAGLTPQRPNLLRVADPEVLGLLVAARDEPGVLYRLSETIFRHGANITYVAGGAHREGQAGLPVGV